MPATNGTLHSAATVSRVIVLGYEDGITDGIIQMAEDGSVYRLELVSQVHNPVGLDERSYDLRPLPCQALDRLTELLAPFQTPTWPVWYPRWQFPTNEIAQRINHEVDALVDAAGKPIWRLTTSDLAGLQNGSLSRCSFTDVP